MWRVLVPLIEITATFVRLRLRRPPATPASDARQRRPPATPVSNTRRRHAPTQKQWAVLRVGLGGPVNNHGMARPYLPDRETPPYYRRMAFWWSSRFLVMMNYTLWSSPDF